MNKYKIILMLLLVPTLSMAQGSYDALKLSKTDIKGSARTMGMAGAFNALGGDPYSLSNNPGGLGVFSRTEVSTTMNLSNSSTSLDKGKGFVQDQSRMNFVFDNFNYVISLDDFGGNGFNVGIGYNRIANFNKDFRGGHDRLNGGLAGYMANKANGFPVSLFHEDIDYQYGNTKLPWLSVLGYDTYLFDVVPGTDNQYRPFSDVKPESFLRLTERGRVDEYAFSVGGKVQDFLYWGATLAVTDMNYSIGTVYSENYFQDGNFDLFNNLETKGTGMTGKFGFIVRPMDFIRIGVAVHTPTYFTLTDFYSSGTNFADIAFDGGYESGGSDAPAGEGSYKLRTPLKVLGGLAFVIGKYGIISADYEFQDFRNARLRSLDGFGFAQNDYIKSDFRAAHTFKVGAEVRPTSQLSLRVGYAYQTSPVSQYVLDGNIEAMTEGTFPHFIYDRGTELITGGIGYRWANFYIDAAVVSRNNKQDIWAFSPLYDGNGNALAGNDNKIAIKNKRFETLLTVGFRF